MNNKVKWQSFKVLLLVQSIFALLGATTGKASAIDIQDTNYAIPSGAYYVSPSGSSSNSGKAPSSPWSVDKALTSAPSGSTIVFRGGIYRGIETKIRKKLQLQAYPHEKPWLKGSVVVTGWVGDGNIWRKDGWTYSFPNESSSAFINPDYPMAGYRDMVYINGAPLQQVGSKAEVVSGTFYVDSSKDQLYIGSNPNGKTVEGTAQKETFLVWGSDLVVRGLGFAHYADRGMLVSAPRVTLEKNTFAWNGAQGVRLYGSDAIVRGNIFSYNGRNGFWAGSGSDRMLLEGNTISYNNVEHFVTSWDAAGIKVINNDRLIWRNNIVENNYSTGMWLDESVTNATVVHNISRHNDAMGIFFEISSKAIIAANLVYDNMVGIMVSNSSGAKVYNNTLVDNRLNLILKDTNRNNTDAEGIAEGITWIARKNVFKNNILSSNNTGNVMFSLSNCGTMEPSSMTVDGLDYNAYYRRSSSKPSQVITWSLGKSNCAAAYSSIDAFKSATSYEDHALAIDNVSTNPFFVDEAGEDYRLKSGSPAIKRGQPLPASVAKAIGVDSGVSVNLGAF